MNCDANRVDCMRSMIELLRVRRESVQKNLAMLRDSELKCELRLVARSTRSITELNTDSHSRQFAANHQEPRGNETHGSCGSTSPSKTVIPASAARHPGFRTSHPNFITGHRRLSARVRKWRALVPNSSASAVSALTVPRLARICATQNAFLGMPRRPVPPHAPMNRSAHRDCGGRVWTILT